MAPCELAETELKLSHDTEEETVRDLGSKTGEVAGAAWGGLKRWGSVLSDKVKDLTVADPEPGALTAGLGQSGLARGSSYEGFCGGGSSTSLQSMGSNGGSSGYQASQENGFGSGNNRLQTIQSLGSDPDGASMPRSASQRSFASSGSGGSRGRASPPAPPAPAQTARTTSSPVPPPAPDLAAGRSASVPSAKPSARKAKKLEVDPDKDFFDSFGV